MGDTSKKCPLCVISGVDGPDCGDSCAWFVESRQACALKVLAVESISANNFTEASRNERMGSCQVMPRVYLQTPLSTAT